MARDWLWLITIFGITGATLFEVDRLMKTPQGIQTLSAIINSKVFGEMVGMAVILMFVLTLILSRMIKL